MSGLGLIGAIDLSSGKYRWAQDRQSRGNKALWHSLQQLEGPVAYGVRVPVQVHGGLESDQPLHMRSGDDAEVVALHWQTGREIWACRLPNTEDEYQPLGVKLGFDGARLYAVLRSQVFVLDRSGTLVHSYRRLDGALADRMILNGSTLYGGDAEGWYALNLSDGRVLWYTPGPPPEAAPLLSDGKLYVTSHHSLMALDARSGQKLWEHTFAHRISGQPVLRDKHLYVASIEGVITRLQLP